jgi:hypothetical protein
LLISTRSNWHTLFILPASSQRVSIFLDEGIVQYFLMFLACDLQKLLIFS